MGNNSAIDVVDEAKIRSNPVMSSMQEIVPGVFLGSILSNDYNLLIEKGIFNVVSVYSASEYTWAYKDWFRYKEIELDSNSLFFNIIPIIRTVNEYIDKCLKKGKVLVHSYYGTSRSVVLVIAYIMEAHKMSLGDALNLVQSKRSCINIDENLMNQLKEYEVINKAQRWYDRGHSSKTVNKKRFLLDVEDWAAEELEKKKIRALSAS